MNTRLDQVSPARLRYIQRRAQRLGLSPEAYLERNLPRPRSYPFGLVEDAQFRIDPVATPQEKLEAAGLVRDFLTEYQQQGGNIKGATHDMLARPQDPVMGINGAEDQRRGCCFYLVRIGQHTVGSVQLGTTVNQHRQPTGTFLNDVYVRPEYRGWGISTRIYQYCVANLRLESIMLSWDRVRNRTEYWSQWFDCWYVEPYVMLQEPNDKALISLSRQDRDGVERMPILGEMTEQSLTREMGIYFRALNQIRQKLTRKGLTSVDRDQLWDLLMDELLAIVTQ